MRQIFFVLFTLGMAFQGKAQQDSTKKSDTVRVGGIVIINKDGNDAGYIMSDSTFKGHHHQYYRHSERNVTTDWFRIDLGFANYADNTNYSSAATQSLSPGATSDRFTLRSGKSSNFDLWFFMQKVNLINHVVNLKYGLGIESYNFRYDDNVVYHQNPLLITEDTISYRKNKLATNYVTIPVMLNFNFSHRHSQPIGFSIGMSAGYLYSAHQKLISDEHGKQKTHSDFNLEPFKFAYIAELNLGPVGLYGSYSVKSMYKYGLDMTPYAIGIRIN